MQVTLCAAVSQSPPGSVAVGQVSPDGQFRWDGAEWVPIPRGAREPTSWTQPMRVSVAAFLAIQAVFAVISTILFVNHDSLVKVMQAQGSFNNLPAGTDQNSVVNIALAFAYGLVVVIALIYLLCALGSYLGWRWMFWVVLVLLGLSSIGALTNLANFANPNNTETPVWGIVINEIFSLGSLGFFVWMLIAIITRGPWAMKKVGA